jgi:hypothetical protein
LKEEAELSDEQPRTEVPDRDADLATGAVDEQADLRGEQIIGEEVRTALIQGEFFEARPVQYTVVDGRAIFEGDIVLGTDEELQRQTQRLQEEAGRQVRGVGSEASPGDSVDPAREPAGLPEAAAVVSGQSKRWPGGVLPFETDPSLTSAAGTAVQHYPWRLREHRATPDPTRAGVVELQVPVALVREAP